MTIKTKPNWQQPEERVFRRSWLCIYSLTSDVKYTAMDGAFEQDAWNLLMTGPQTLMSNHENESEDGTVM